MHTELPVLLVLMLSCAMLAAAAERPAIHPGANTLDNRLCRIESRPGGPVTGDPTEWVEWIDELGVDLWVCSAVDPSCNVNYDSAVGYPSGEFDPEYLPKLLAMAHERDIAVISWIGPTFSKGACQANPQWRQVYLDDPTKKPLKDEDNAFLCPNNPHARAFIKAELAEIVGELGFDGIWFDGMVFGSMDTIPFRVGCKCPYCAERYKEEVGADIPQTVDMGDANFRRFVRWRYAVMDEYMLELYEAIREANPRAHVATGNYYRPGHGWDAGTYMAPQKFPGTASGENNIVGDQAYETVNTGFNGRMMKAINPYSFELWRPVWDFQIGFPPAPEPVQTTVSLLLQFAQGGHTFCGWGGTRPGATDALKPGFAELKRRQQWHSGEPLHFAAMHYSQRARDFAYPGGGAQYDKMASGIHQALAESHVIFDYVLDGQLTPESLKRFAVVILPSSGCINQQEAQDLHAYVRQGGRLIVTGETSLYDDLGKKRDDFLLADLMGVHYTASRPPLPYPKTAPVGVVQDELMLESLPRLVWFISASCEFELDEDSGAQMAVAISQANEATGHDDVTAQPTDKPLATIRQVGAGEVIYIGADLGMAYANHPYQRVRRLLESWVNRADPWLEVEAPKVIEVTAFSKNGATVIHLVNSPSTSLRPTVAWQRLPLVDEIVPVHDINLTVKGQFGSCRLEPSGVTPALEQDDGRTRVIVPRVDIHEMVILRP